MAAPKQRHTKSRRNRRRSHHALKQKEVFLCPKCKSSILPHRLCSNCGTYAGKEIIDVLAKLDKKERKKKQQEITPQDNEQKQNLSMQGLSQK